MKNPPANAGDMNRCLIQEDPTCQGATKPMGPKYRSPRTLEPETATREGLAARGPHRATREQPPPATAREKAVTATEAQHGHK